MRRSWGSTFLLNAAALILPGICILQFTPAPLHCAEQVKLDAKLAFRSAAGDAVLKLDHWCPLSITITFSPTDRSRVLRAELRVSFQSGGSTPWGDSRRVMYKKPIYMGFGRKAFTMCVLASVPLLAAGTGQIDVQLVRSEDGCVIACTSIGKKRQVRLLQGTAKLLLQLGGKGGFLPQVLSMCRQQETVGGDDEPGQGAWDNADPDIATALLAPECAPDTWIGYQAADVVLWHDPDPAHMRASQIQALRDWVLFGGRLAITWSSPGAERGLRVLGEMLPAEVDGQVELALIPAGAAASGAAARAGDRVGGWMRLPACIMEACSGAWEARVRAGGVDPALVRAMPATGNLQLARLAPTSGRVLLPLHQPGPPLVVRKSLGAGSVTMVAPYLQQGPLKRFAGTQALLGRAMQVVFDRNDIAAVTGKNFADNRRAGRMAGFSPGAEILRAARVYLSDAPPLHPVSFWLIACFLAAYVFVVGPLDYLLLSRMRCLRLTWLTLLLYVIVFAILAFVGAGFVKGRRAFCRSLSVHDIVANEPAVCERQFFGLFSVNTGRVDLEFGEQAWPVAIGELTFARSSTDPDYGGGYPADGGAVAVVQGGIGKLIGVPMGKWSMKYFTGVRIKHEAHRIVSGDLRLDGRKLTGGFTSGEPLHDCLLLSRAGVYELGEILPNRRFMVETDKSRMRLITFLAELKSEWDMWQYRNLQKLEFTVEPEHGKLGTNTPAGLVRMLAAVSLHQVLTSWERGLRARIRKAQHVRPFAGDLPSPQSRLDSAGGTVLVDQKEPPAKYPGPLIGLSVEQVWNMLLDPDDRCLPDLSGVLLRGGVILFARTGRLPREVHAENLNLERQGETLVRVVFPAGPRAHGGEVWQDDLY